MKETDRKALIALPVVVLLGALVAVAGSQGGATLGGIPVFAMAVGAAFLDSVAGLSSRRSWPRPRSSMT